MSTKTNPTWFHRNPKKTLFATFLFLFLTPIFATEFILRNIDKKNNTVHSIYRTIRLKEHPPLLDTLKIPDQLEIKVNPTLAGKKFRFRTDYNGFIQPSEVYKNPDIKIVFLGGSTTECSYVDENLRFPYMTGLLLSTSLKKKVNSYNSGVSGNNSVNSLNILLNKVIPLSPDVVVMMHNVNDLNTLIYTSSYWNNNPFRSQIVTKIKTTYGNNKTKFYNFLRATKDLFFPAIYNRMYDFIDIGHRLNPHRVIDEFADIRGKKKTINRQEVLQKFKTSLALFISMCRSSNIIPVLMTQANRLTDKPESDLVVEVASKLELDHGIKYDDYKYTYDLFNEVIRDVAKERDVLVIELDRLVLKSADYMLDVFHFNNVGSEYVANIIANRIRQLLDDHGLL